MIVRFRALVVPAALLVGAAGALFVVFVGGSSAFFGSEPIGAAMKLLALVALVAWLGCSWGGWLRTPAWAVATTVLALTALVVSTVFSVYPRLSLEFLPGAALMAAALLTVAGLTAHPAFDRRLQTFIVALAVVIGCLYLIQCLVLWIAWWGVIGQLSAPPTRPFNAALSFGSPNTLATLLVLLGPLAVSILVSRSARAAAAALAVLLLLAVFLTGSRGGLAAAGATLVVIVLGVLVRERRRLAAFIGTGWWKLAAAAVGAGALALAAAPFVWDRFSAGGADIRLLRLAVSRQLFETAPITGTGPGTWAIEYLGFATPGEARTEPAVAHAHNLYAQIGAELGLIGVAAAMVIVGMVGWRLVTLVGRGGQARSILALAVIGSLIGLGVQSVVENSTFAPSVNLVLVLVVAAGCAGVDAPVRILRPWVSRAAYVAVVGVILVAAPLLAGTERAAELSAEGDGLATCGDWSSAAARYQEAAAIDPDFALYHSESGLALAWLGRLDEAITEYELGVRHDRLPEHLVSLAYLYTWSGRLDDARSLAREALGASEGRAVVELNAGRIGELTDDQELALTGYANAIATIPDIAGDPYWSSPDRSLVPRDVMRQALREVDRRYGGSTYQRVLILAHAGFSEDARREADALPPSVSRDLLVSYIAWVDDPSVDSLAGLVDVAARDPRNLSTINLVLAAAEQTPNASGVGGLYYWSQLVGQTLYPPFLSEIAPNDDPGWRSIHPLYPGSVYLRSGPENFLPPMALAVRSDTGSSSVACPALALGG